MYIVAACRLTREDITLQVQEMAFGPFIKHHRDSLELTQKELGSKVGCSDGYIAHIESEKKIPSLELCMAISQVFGLTREQEENLLEEVENARAAHSQSRIRARGAAVRRAFRNLGNNGAKGAEEADTAQFLKLLGEDPQSQAAVEDLRVALSDPKIRPAVLTTLRAFAESAKLNKQDQ